METQAITHRIALIDDEPQILSALKRELRGQPLALAAFDSAPAALEAVCREDFALILSDNLMPGLTGLELLAKVKETHPATRRLLLTGRTDLNHAVDAFNAGVIHGFLHKPWDKAKLWETIQKELGIYQAQQEAEQATAKLAEQNKVRTAKLISALKELKQAQTQLVLLEDTLHLDVLGVPASVKGLSILIVEEHEAVRDLLVRAIKGAGIAKCQAVPHANAALLHLAAAPPVDVILSEWSLEGVDGLEFLRRLRASKAPSANALFLLMAGHEHKAMVEFALKSGVDGYLIKPFRLQSLFAHIASLRNRDSAARFDDLAPLRGASVLVVNSHPASREGIEAFLAQAGITGVQGATFGPGAVNLIKKHNPDIVVYDVNVKDPTWEELRAQFKKQQHPPALLVTGVLADEDVATAMGKAGVKHYLPGPFTQASLLRALAACWQPPGG